ncbi:MAG: hypothetical protein MK135_11420, partial [Polyangiaceae bacterium]|nr:hypothetical protein [Polyangiaceae bacterium]
MRGALEVRQSEFIAERHAGRRAGRQVLRHEGNRFGKRSRFGLMSLRLLTSSVVFFASILALAESKNTDSAGAEERASSAAREIDRAVVRFSAPEAGGEAYPQFIFERELAF